MCMKLNGGSSLKGELVTSREVSKTGDSMETFWGSCIMLFAFRECFHQAGDMRRDIRRIRGAEIKGREQNPRSERTKELMNK